MRRPFYCSCSEQSHLCMMGPGQETQIDTLPAKIHTVHPPAHAIPWAGETLSTLALIVLSHCFSIAVNNRLNLVTVIHARVVGVLYTSPRDNKINQEYANVHEKIQAAEEIGISDKDIKKLLLLLSCYPQLAQLSGALNLYICRPESVLTFLQHVIWGVYFGTRNSRMCQPDNQSWLTSYRARNTGCSSSPPVPTPNAAAVATERGRGS